MSDFTFATPEVRQDGSVSMGSDARMYVKFYKRAVQMGAASEEAGRPIFEDRDYVHIQHPGERDAVDREVTEMDRLRWRERWQAYQDGQEHAETGTPLLVLFPSNPALVEMLKPMRIHTVEQLAGLTEQAMSRVGMGARNYVDMAKRFLEEAKAAAPFSRMEAQLEQERARREELESNLQQALERIKALESETPSIQFPARERRGRNADQ